MEKEKIVYERPEVKVVHILTMGCFCMSQPDQEGDDGEIGVWEPGSW